MSTDEKTVNFQKKEIKEAKKQLKEGFIDNIIKYIETKENCFSESDTYFKYYSIIQDFSDMGKDSELFLYHNEVIKDYLKKCFQLLSSQPEIALIDLFIKQTENINFLIYWMNRLFTYLDRFYMKEKNKGTLSKNEMNLYKENYFNPLKIIGKFI